MIQKRKGVFLVLFLLLASVQLPAVEKAAVRIACVGNSITFGSGVNNKFQNSYPGVLQQLFGDGYDVRNFGVGGRTLLKKGDYPYFNEQAYKDALAFQPNIVTIKLGTNDSKPQNWKYGKEFESNLLELIHSFKALPSKPRIYLCFPVPPVYAHWGINKDVIKNEIIPIIMRVAKREHLKTIDLYSALLPYPQYFHDGIHPDEQGAQLIANEIYRHIAHKSPRALNVTQAFPGDKTTWNGCDRYDFTCFGRHATVVVPQHVAEGAPWIWRPAFFDASSSADKALLEQGFYIVYYDLTNLYGSPLSMDLGDRFYNVMCRYYHLSSRVTLEGFSRGGHFVFDWAARNPGKVTYNYTTFDARKMYAYRSNVYKFYIKQLTLSVIKTILKIQRP